MKASSCATVDERRTTASFSNAGVPLRLALHPPAVPLPLVSNTLPVESSTTTPPGLQKPAPCPGVTYGGREAPPLVGTANTQPWYAPQSPARPPKGT